MALKITSLRLLLVVATIGSSPRIHAKELIYCISTPRSLSSAFFRMVEARGDAVCLEEPGVTPYTELYEPEASDIVCSPGTPRTFSAASERIIDATKSSKIVFVKEMGFAARHYLFSGELGKLNAQQAVIIFLVRNPHASLISLYRKRPEPFPLLEDWMDYGKLWELFEQTSATYAHTPLVVMAEELAAHPVKVVHAICDHCAIPFEVSQLHWDALAHTMDASHPWNNDVGWLWSDRVIQSTCFETLSTYKLDDEGNPTFQEIENLEHRARYRALYEKDYPYYQKFVAAAKQLVKSDTAK